MVLSFDSDAAKWKYRDKPIATKRSHKPFEFQKKDAKWVDWNIRDVVTGLAQAVLLQRLLRPLHDWAMDVLRRLPCDGTFDQPKPLIRLTGRSIVSSCDLTAATDRWPYQLISQLVESWFGRGIATAAIDTCLVSNSIHILPPWSDKPTVGMQSDVSVNMSPTRGVLGGARKRLRRSY